jgi:hypothetical protein
MTTENLSQEPLAVKKPATYQGLMCQCKTCAMLTEEERKAKALRIVEARRKGGKTRAAQESMTEARSKGFWTTMERHPFFARHWLKIIIKSQNVRRQRIAGTHILIVGQTTGKRRPMK